MPQVDADNIDEFIDEIKLHLASEQCHVNIFACVYNPFTKIKKSTNSFTHAETLKLAQLLPLAFRRFEAKKGFKSELYAIALQDVIWKVFDYEKLRKEKKEHLFAEARQVWMHLEEWAQTEKATRAILFTTQYCTQAQIDQLAGLAMFGN